MKFKNFTYKKKKDDQTKKYLVLITRDDQTHFGGIDLTKLGEAEIRALLDIQKEYETDMKPFVEKAYRMYIKENVIDEDDTGDPEQLFGSKQ